MKNSLSRIYLLTLLIPNVVIKSSARDEQYLSGAKMLLRTAKLAKASTISKRV